MDLKAYREKVGFARFYLFIFGLIGIAFWLGYQFAQAEKQTLLEEQQLLSKSLNNLTKVHETLKSEHNMLKVELDIAQLTNEKNQADYQESLERERALKEQVSFYQRVMAPEMSQDGFVIDKMQITPTNSEHNYFVNMILLQHENIKAVIKGDLDITIYGSKNGKPSTLKLESVQDEPKVPLSYAFKYFQVFQTSITLPSDFLPERLEITTSVYKYRKKRGDYKISMLWEDALIE